MAGHHRLWNSGKWREKLSSVGDVAFCHTPQGVGVRGAGSTIGCGIGRIANDVKRDTWVEFGGCFFRNMWKAFAFQSRHALCIVRMVKGETVNGKA